MLPHDGNRPVLCRTKRDAAEINDSALATLPDQGVYHQGRILGDFPHSDLPTSENLLLKRDARVMLLMNRQKQFQTSGYEYVNGDTGVIVDYSSCGNQVRVLLDRGACVSITPATWTNYEYDVETRHGEPELVERPIGFFQQLPIAPAYATTIHKAQGQTLPQVHLSLGRGCFAPGQLYTALSRVRSFDDLTLDQPIRLVEALNDPQILDFHRCHNL